MLGGEFTALLVRPRKHFQIKQAQHRAFGHQMQERRWPFCDACARRRVAAQLRPAIAREPRAKSWEGCPERPDHGLSAASAPAVPRLPIQPFSDLSALSGPATPSLPRRTVRARRGAQRQVKRMHPRRCRMEPACGLAPGHARPRRPGSMQARPMPECPAVRPRLGPWQAIGAVRCWAGETWAHGDRYRSRPASPRASSYRPTFQWPRIGLRAE